MTTLMRRRSRDTAAGGEDGDADALLLLMMISGFDVTLSVPLASTGVTEL